MAHALAHAVEVSDLVCIGNRNIFQGQLIVRFVGALELLKVIRHRLDQDPPPAILVDVLMEDILGDAIVRTDLNEEKALRSLRTARKNVSESAPLAYAQELGAGPYDQGIEK